MRVRVCVWVGVSVCARLTLKVPRRRPLPARPSAAQGSDCARDLSPSLGGEEVSERRFENPERGIRLQPGRRRRRGGGGAEAVGGGKAGARGAQRPVRPLGVSGGLGALGAFRCRHFLASKVLGSRLSARWGRGVLELGLGVWVASAKAGGWDSEDAADSACYSKLLRRIPALSKSFRFLAGKTRLPLGVPRAL